MNWLNWLDYAVLFGTMLGIAIYGVWRTRGRCTLQSYLKGADSTPWIVIGLSVMATQASAITFLSTPGQGYEDGLGFVQNYFGAPFALIIIAVFFLPIYRKLKVYTAYEYLGQRFDKKTRLLGAFLFLIQRGLGAGITIYAPAIVLSTVFHWRLDLTIVCSGMLVIIYTVAGGSDAVNLTQKYQIGVIFVGMIIAFFILLSKLPGNLSDALSVAGGFHKLQAVDFSLNVDRRYTFWSGTLGGMFLALSYFGTDQSQVQRYITGSSLRESRLGLMFNAVCKIPMQFFILLIGTMLFVFYQFQPPPVYFDQTTWNTAAEQQPSLRKFESDYATAYAEKQASVQRWIDSRHAGDQPGESRARSLALEAHQRTEKIRADARKALTDVNKRAKPNETDFVFITFILGNLPHGLIGLLVAVFFAATFSSKAAELNALGSTTTVDIYRHVIRTDAPDSHYVIASKCFTVFWGLVALAFALFASLAENLIQAVNIVGSIFYGVVLGMFLVAFSVKWVHGTAVFIAAVIAQLLVFGLYYTLNISYLWYNFIGCAACVGISVLLQLVLQKPPQARGFQVVMPDDDSPKP